MSYWDTSTLVKLYAKESDSALFESHLLRTVASPTTSRLALYEVRATLRRKEAEGILIGGTAQLLYERLGKHCAAGVIRLIELSADLEREYGQVLDLCYTANPLVPIRSLDAIHLASAKVTLEREIVTTDKRMREAAKQLGFALFPN